MLHYGKINMSTGSSDATATAPTQATHTAPTIRIHQPDDNQNLVCFKTGSEQVYQQLTCGYNCFISDENLKGERADIIINDKLCLDNLRLGGVYLNVITKPQSRYFMAFPYGNHTSIIDVSAGEEMYVNRENFVACHVSPSLTVEKAYGVTTRNSDAAKLLLNKERWLKVGPPSATQVNSKRRRSSRRSSSRLSQKQRHNGGNPSYSIALGGISQLSLVKLLYNSIQVDDDNVVAVIGDIQNIAIKAIHSAQKKHSLTGLTAGRVVTGERTGEGLHFIISHKHPQQSNIKPIYVVLQGNVYGRTEVITDIHTHASSGNSGGDGGGGD